MRLRVCWGLVSGGFLLALANDVVSQHFVVDKPLEEYLVKQKPIAPADAVKTFQLPDDLSIELVAAEPLITDPVAIAFDEHARMYVVEMGGYPMGGPDGEPQSRVRLLEDKDGDGYYETSHVFVDKLTFPSGVTAWDGGVYVTCAPDVFYYKDTDGDGKADVERKAFGGFGTWNQQHRANGLVYGLDNQLYVSNGDSQGMVYSPKTPDKKVNIRGMDFRFTPGSEAYEAISGSGQFGTSFSNWGRRFICNNRIHIREMILPRRYLARNPSLAVQSAHAVVSDHGEACQVFPTSKQLPRWIDLDHVGFITAACGVQIYRGEALPGRYAGHAFVCDPVYNLVHQDLIDHQAGPAVVARRAEPDREFLTSTDQWSRPVFLANGPEGALYMVDMYRAIIEHTEWIPDSIEKIVDVKQGMDRGRIYRIVTKDKKRPAPVTLGGATTLALVAHLANPNAWVRETAQRLLFEHQDRSAVGALKVMAQTQQAPLGRLHALWTLHGMGALDEGLLAAALADEHPWVREHAARLSEPFLAESSLLREKLVGLCDEPDGRVRMQLAFSLGEMPGEAAIGALAKIAARDAGDPWIRAAVLSSVNGVGSGLLARLVQGHQTFLAGDEPEAREFLQQLCQSIGASRDAGQVDQVLALVVRNAKSPEAPWWGEVVLAGTAAGIDKGGKTKLQLSTGQGSLLALLRNTSPAIRREAHRLASSVEMVETAEQKAAVAAAMKTAADENASEEDRVLALQTLGYGAFDVVGETLADLLPPQNPQAIRAAAVQTVSMSRSHQAAKLLLEHWPTFTPDLQNKTLDVFLERQDWIGFLIQAMKEDAIPAWSLDAARRQQLLRHPDSKVQDLVKGLFDVQPGERDFDKTIASFKASLTLRGDLKAGRVLFEKLCAACHKIGELGHEVGPDLTGIRNRPKESLLEDMINPSKALAPGYTAYAIETEEGELLTGVITAEAANNVTLRKQGGEIEVLLRKDIVEMFSTRKSLMPDELEKDLKPADMADLLAFIKSLKYTRGPMAHWRFEKDEEDASGSIVDQVLSGDGEGNQPAYIDDVPDATLYDPIEDMSYPNKRSIQFDGQDDYVRLGELGSPDLGSKDMRQTQTIEFFVKLMRPPGEGSPAGLLVGRWTQSSYEGDHLAVFLNGDASISCVAQSAVGGFDSEHNSGNGGTLKVGTWHHVAGVYQFDPQRNAATVAVYLDYALASMKTFPAGGPLRPTRRGYQLGGEGDATTGGFRFVAGHFDEVRISNEALSPKQFLRKGGSAP